MIVRKIDPFDLRQIALSGQCFRMEELGAEQTAALWELRDDFFGEARKELQGYRIISGGRLLLAIQGGDEMLWFCGDDEVPYWDNYFDVQTDYGAYLSAADEEDGYLCRASRFGSGIRILRQDLWETIISFVISQQKSIPNIRALVKRISARYGKRILPETGRYGDRCLGSPEPEAYSFPTPLELSAASLEDLTDMKLGYRAKYIKRLCEDVLSGDLDLELLRKMQYGQARKYLLSFYGIGEKVADCICLFGLHHIDAFPIDTWIRKILFREYLPRSRKALSVPEGRRASALAEEFFSRYEGFSGVMQQYLFYYERMKPEDEKYLPSILNGAR